MSKKVSEERIRQVHKKATIIKPRVGCVKTSVYDLPANEHTYGFSKVKDPEGAGECN